MRLDPYVLRARFPAFGRQVEGRLAVYLDGPGGTQVPDTVIEAMARILSEGVSNLGGGFASSELADQVTTSARAAIADFYGAEHPDCIAFGQNMTSITFSLSRAMARDWRPGDRVVVTRLDHDANITPWRIAAAERGATVDAWDIDPDTTALGLENLWPLLSERTRLVAVTHASNALGTMVDVARVVEAAHSLGALVYVDAVHYAPHGLIDVTATGCDFLVASAYKFFGPHTGALYGKREHLERLSAYKVRPAPAELPWKWETGTQSFESLAGVRAAVDYLASIGTGTTRRERLVDAMARIGEHEAWLGRRFLAAVGGLSGIRLFGLNGMGGRTPTFAFDVAGRRPEEVAVELGRRGLFVWWGHYYAVEVMERLGLLDRGGLVRVGFVHTTTADEVDLLLEELSRLI